MGDGSWKRNQGGGINGISMKYKNYRMGLNGLVGKKLLTRTNKVPPSSRQYLVGLYELIYEQASQIRTDYLKGFYIHQS